MTKRDLRRLYFFPRRIHLLDPKQMDEFAETSSSIEVLLIEPVCLKLAPSHLRIDR